VLDVTLVRKGLVTKRAKQVNLLGGYSAAMAQMEADGIKKDQIPHWMGGGSQGIVTKDFVDKLLVQNGI